MPLASLDLLMIAGALGSWELVVVAAVCLMLTGFKIIPKIMHDAGKSAGGIFGKAATEALTPDNQTAELYDPAVFRRSPRKRSVRAGYFGKCGNVFSYG